MAKKGLIIVYIGDGKGKTSAAAGLATRAAGTGFKVLYLQFVKGDWPSGERESLGKLGVEVKLMGRGFVGILGDRKPLEEHIKAAQVAKAEAIKYLQSQEYNLVVLDEALSAIESKLLTEEDVLEIMEKADLVTEMKMIKHPYYSGILAQRGIDY